MKKNVLLFSMLLLSTVLNAQFESSTVHKRLTTFTSPGSSNDGYSQGLKYNLNFDFGGYISPTVYVFPKLRGTDYVHIGSDVGYNVYFDRSWRIYSGIFLGGVVRHYKYIDSGGIYVEEIVTNGTFALQAGIQWKLGRNPFFVGAQSFFQYRTDPGNEPNYWRFNGFVEIGIILN